MGQAGSSAQQQQGGDGGTPKERDKDKERERESPRTLRSNLGTSRGLRRGERGERGDRNEYSERAGKDGSSGLGAASAAGAGAGKVPRRKSLDMPDMSLSMSGPGALTDPLSAAPTPNLSISPVAGKYAASSSTSNPSHPILGQAIDAFTEEGRGRAQSALPHSDGLPMAQFPLPTSPLSPQGPAVTSASAAAQAKEAASRWARRKDKEGFGKKAQPITGSASALHAVAFNAPQSQPGSPAAPAGTASRVSLSPVVTSNTFVLPSPFSPEELSASTEPKGDVWLQQYYQQQALQGNAGSNAVGRQQQADQQAQTHALTHPPSDISSPAYPPFHPATDSTNLVATLNPAFSISSTSAFTPLQQPVESILAPKLPNDVQLTIPQRVASEAAHDIVGRSMADLEAVSEELAGFTSNNAGSRGSGSISADATAVAGPSLSSGSTAIPANYSSPLIPGSTPPLGNPPNTLPAAAPMAALHLGLAQDVKAQEAVNAATVDLGAGPDGVPTLLTWKAAEEETTTEGIMSPPGDAAGPQQVFVTGTFAKGWGTKIELRRKEGEDHKQTNDFTALVKLPPGPHSLKFIVDKQWKTSKYLPSATDADGNLINYLQVHKVDQVPRLPAVESHYQDYEDEDEDAAWTSEIPPVLVLYGDATEAALDAQEAQERAVSDKGANLHSGGTASLPVPVLPSFTPPGSYQNQGASSIPSVLPNAAAMALNRKPLSQLQAVQPPTLPAQLERGVLNATLLVAKGSGDDNSILPKPDHSVLNHLAASPIKGGLLSVGVTTRYRRKYVTTVYYKKPVV